ncbi:MAG: hypothetical protein OXR72_05490 [Gemmatimonadota bacterium]|nr:hypothetical protein [Gemmatimonadota bacterium]
MKKAVVFSLALTCCGNSDTSRQIPWRPRPAQAVAKVAEQRAVQGDSIYQVTKTRLTQVRMLASPYASVRITSIKSDKAWMQKLQKGLQPMNLSTLDDLVNKAQEYFEELKTHVEETKLEAENAKISALADNAENAEIYTRRAMEANRKAQSKAETTLGLLQIIERVIDNIDLSRSRTDSK